MFSNVSFCLNWEAKVFSLMDQTIIWNQSFTGSKHDCLLPDKMLWGNRSDFDVNWWLVTVPIARGIQFTTESEYVQTLCDSGLCLMGTL